MSSSRLDSVEQYQTLVKLHIIKYFLRISVVVYFIGFKGDSTISLLVCVVLCSALYLADWLMLECVRWLLTSLVFSTLSLSLFFHVTIIEQTPEYTM